MRAARLVLVIAAALTGAGCGSTTTSRTASPAGEGSIRVSGDFRSGGFIPRTYTCDGKDLSPPLRASGLPAATRELVVVMRDPDAPGGDFVHWGIAHINPAPGRAGSMVLPVAARPPGAVPGLNSFGALGYRGPCPPRGDPAHHYTITVYALGRLSMLTRGFSAAAVTALPALAKGSLTGIYARR